ncbi:MAG: MoaD/ThiS family protein [Methanocellales archaeon]|nr:MoaD/ThiS family protein [Methanocellales archaeon]MDI6903222.1 MoaD/ThiS family protein [Methanocellales archaeon]
MMVKVKFFASYREMLGEVERDVQLQDGARVRDIIDMLVIRCPELAGENAVIALNHVITKEDAKLKDGDVVAIFPPVSGG